MPSNRKINVSKPAAKPATVPAIAIAKPAKPVSPPVAAKPAKPVSTPADKLASRLTTRETRNVDYFTTASYPAEKLSPADQIHLATFAAFAKANGGIIRTADLDLADRDAGKLVNNRARARRLSVLGFLQRTGDAAHARFTFVPAITANAAPANASPNVLAVRSIYAKA